MKPASTYPIRCDKCGKFTSYRKEDGRVVAIRRKGQKTRIEYWCTRENCGKKGKRSR